MQTLNNTKTTENRTSQSEPFLILDNVSKVYQTQKGPYPVLEGVNLTVNEGEFICLIGHSGCGKSTLLNMVAGFNQPTSGQVRLQGSPITEPGPDRMVVFQNYSLLPWMSASENIHLGVETVYADKPREAHHQIVKEHLELVGLTEAANKKPGQLSGGMKQRVAIARALATRPQLLILDEPFGALDPITREELQEELLTIWREHKVTVLMITHDIDEALFLADRVVMMTNGPSAYIGEDLKVPFARPRNRARIMEDPQYYELRNFALDFLFRRYAHTEGDEETTSGTSQTNNQSQQIVSQPESHGNTELSTRSNPEPDPKAATLATTSPTTIPFNASTATKESSMSSESGSSTKSKNIALAAGWLIAMIGLTAVAVTSVSNQKETTETATTSAPSAVLASPSAPPPPPAPPVSAVPQTTAVAPSPASASPVSSAIAADATSPSPSSTAVAPSPASASPASAAIAADTSSPSPSSAEASPTTVTPTTQAAVGMPVDEIGKKLYEQIDQNWRTAPTFTENLIYRVKVAQNGSVLQYEPTNDAAKKFVQETPLATLQKNSSNLPAADTKTTAEFRVTFTPNGTLEIQP